MSRYSLPGAYLDETDVDDVDEREEYDPFRYDRYNTQPTHNMRQTRRSHWPTPLYDRYNKYGTAKDNTHGIQQDGSTYHRWADKYDEEEQARVENASIFARLWPFASRVTPQPPVRKTVAELEEDWLKVHTAKEEALSECIRSTMVPITYGETYDDGLEPPKKECTKCQSVYSVFRVHPYSALHSGPLPISEACPTCYEETATELYETCKAHHEIFEPVPPTTFMPFFPLDETGRRPSSHNPNQPSNGYRGPRIRTCTECSRDYEVFRVRPYDANVTDDQGIGPISGACLSCYQDRFKDLSAAYWKHLKLLGKERSSHCPIPHIINLQTLDVGGVRRWDPNQQVEEHCSQLGAFRDAEVREIDAFERSVDAAFFGVSHEHDWTTFAGPNQFGPAIGQDQFATPWADRHDRPASNANQFGGTFAPGQFETTFGQPHDGTTFAPGQFDSMFSQTQTQHGNTYGQTQSESAYGQPQYYGVGDSSAPDQPWSYWPPPQTAAQQSTIQPSAAPKKRTWLSRLSRLFTRKKRHSPTEQVEPSLPSHPTRQPSGPWQSNMSRPGQSAPQPGPDQSWQSSMPDQPTLLVPNWEPSMPSQPAQHLSQAWRPRMPAQTTEQPAQTWQPYERDQGPTQEYDWIPEGYNAWVVEDDEESELW